MVGGKIFFTDHPAHPGTERKQPPTVHFDDRLGEHMSVNMKRANASLNGTTALATTKLTTPMTHSIMADLRTAGLAVTYFFVFLLSSDSQSIRNAIPSARETRLTRQRAQQQKEQSRTRGM